MTGPMTGHDGPEPRWLSPDEQQAWIGVTAVMWLLPGPLDAQLQRDSCLNLFDYFVLSSLSMADGQAAPDERAGPAVEREPLPRLQRRGQAGGPGLGDPPSRTSTTGAAPSPPSPRRAGRRWSTPRRATSPPYDAS